MMKNKFEKLKQLDRIEYILLRNKIVELMGDISRIELFAREKVEGWDCWGNEIK